MSEGSVQRLAWDDLPQSVRSAARDALGSHVVGEIGQTGGFSPGLASRLRLADGRWVFAKAINGDRNPTAPGLYRREAAVMSVLPDEVPAPALVWTYDDDDWVMLVLEDVDGVMPGQPWDRVQLDSVIAAMADLAAVRGASALPIPTPEEDLADNFRSWAVLAEAEDMTVRLGMWERANLERLVGLESLWVPAAEGDALVHADLRADNMILADDRVTFVDWPYALAGVAWLDMVLFVPSAIADGGVDAAEAWSRFPPAQDADDDAVNAVLAAAAGDWTYQSLLPPPANVPSLRAHQREKARAALTWLRTRIG
ncbi:phosphotransferase [Amycolatopsis sp. NPDC004079]|uniref:phosphotransferase n=1 Tax=Amycolatopsis sp. NPDC004079 TaxID=3154549 RepID=UPI0033A476E2